MTQFSRFWSRRDRLAALSVGLGLASPSRSAGPTDTLRVGISIAELPTTTGQPTQGGTGFRWAGWTIFDFADLLGHNQDQKIPTEIPYLAEEYRVSPENKSKWVFKLRRGVKFHDGSDFNADAVIWNLEKLFDKNAPQYDPKQISATLCCMLDVKGWRKIDDHTVEIDTGTPNAMTPYRLPWLRIASPTQWKKLGSWEAFEKIPPAPGPSRPSRWCPVNARSSCATTSIGTRTGCRKSARMELLPIPTTTRAPRRCSRARWT